MFTCVIAQCSSAEFPCLDGNCIAGILACDGVANDCPDGSDENDCGVYYVMCVYMFS
jgi:hypothetical protein